MALKKHRTLDIASPTEGVIFTFPNASIISDIAFKASSAFCGLGSPLSMGPSRFGGKIRSKMSLIAAHYLLKTV